MKRIKMMSLTMALLVNCLCALPLWGQAKGEEMASYVAQLSQDRDGKVLLELANKFEAVAKEQPAQWLPLYYAAYAYVRLADNDGGKKIDHYCDKAEKLLDQAQKIAPNHSEILALYSYKYSTRIKVSPMMRGMTMGKKSGEYSRHAIEADPSNPRPYLIRAIGMYHTPSMFGGGASKALSLVQEALTRYESQVPQSPLHPTWGKGTAKWLEEQCLKDLAQ